MTVFWFHSNLFVFLQIIGGQLLTRIQEYSHFSEQQAAEIVREIATALCFLHGKGIAHRDLKPENILCVYRDKLCPIKICDFDLGSGINFSNCLTSPLATPQLRTPVSLSFSTVVLCVYKLFFSLNIFLI